MMYIILIFNSSCDHCADDKDSCNFNMQPSIMPGKGI